MTFLAAARGAGMALGAVALGAAVLVPAPLGRGIAGPVRDDGTPAEPGPPGLVERVDERLVTQRKDLEKAIDEAVRRTANRFRIPSQADIDALAKRVDEVAARIDAITQEKQGG